MSRILRFFVFLVFLLVWQSVIGQQDKLKRAKEFFTVGKYEETLSLLNTDPFFQTNREAQLLIALSYYNKNQLVKAEQLMQDAVNSDKDPYKEYYLYLGRIYHAQHDFQKATTYYKNYLKLVDQDHPNRSLLIDEIRRCANGLSRQYNQPLAIVENLGPQINTPYDEFGPILSPNRMDRLYFTSARPGSSGGLRLPNGRPDNLFGHFTNDLFVASLTNGQWSQVKGMHYLLNSPQHEVLFGFNMDGKVLYYFKGPSLENGSIFLDTFQQNRRVLTSDPFFGPVDANASINSPHFFDPVTVIFASRRPGGYGGLDLYQTSFLYGNWTPPKNMGPEINTPYDETTPFLAADRQTLYYSSNNPNQSIGGFDILKTVYSYPLSRWSTPYNLGLPINSAGDDTHFRLARDGYTAFFSSNRKDAYGKRDIFAAYFFDYLHEMNRTTTSTTK